MAAAAGFKSVSGTLGAGGWSVGVAITGWGGPQFQEQEELIVCSDGTASLDGQPVTVATATPCPSEGSPVGGIVDEIPDSVSAWVETPDSSGPGAGVLAGVPAGVLAGTVALGGAAWYVRRRPR